MAKVTGEKRDSLSKVEKGLGVKELKFRLSFGAEDMHYPGEMISGCKLMEKCIDCCTEITETAVLSYIRKLISWILFICWMRWR